jgi:hypothetical protein
MFVAYSDETAGALVGVYGETTTEEDYARCVESILGMDAALAGRDRPFVCILVTQRGTPAPPPSWRNRMAEANKSLRAQRYYFALVCPSALLRGALTAILWITGSREGHQYSAFATFADAVSWIERESRDSYPTLQLLYDRAAVSLRDAG